MVMVESDGISTDGQATKEGPRKNGHEVPNVHGHNSQHPAFKSERVAHKCQAREILQQIRNPCNNSIYHRPERIHAQPPRPRAQASLLHHHNFLLDAVLSEDQPLGIAILAYPFRLARSPGHDDIAAIEFRVEPGGLFPALERQQAAEEGCEQDQEYARPSVGGRVCGGPAVGVEGCRDGGEEGHAHLAHGA